MNPHLSSQPSEHRQHKEHREITPLFLGPADSPILSFLNEVETRVYQCDEKLSTLPERYADANFIVSYGYRYIIPADILRLFPDAAINLHISLLPWNRGADPNLWSFLEDSPKGVTIHKLDPGVDTGDILLQEHVNFSGNETLHSSYLILCNTIEALFRSNWDQLKVSAMAGRPQAKETQAGSFHKAADKAGYAHLLERGWDTPIQSLIGKANPDSNS